MARHTLLLWAVANLVRSLRTLEARRHWNRLLAQVQTKLDAMGEVVWEVSVDSTVARAHQHAAGARCKPSLEDEKGGSNTTKTRRSGEAEED